MCITNWTKGAFSQGNYTSTTSKSPRSTATARPSCTSCRGRSDWAKNSWTRSCQTVKTMLHLINSAREIYKKYSFTWNLNRNYILRLRDCAMRFSESHVGISVEFIQPLSSRRRWSWSWSDWRTRRWAPRTLRCTRRSGRAWSLCSCSAPWSRSPEINTMLRFESIPDIISCISGGNGAVRFPKFNYLPTK